MKYISLLLIFTLFFNCKNEIKKEDVKQLTANEIVEKSIEVSGGEKFNNSNISFNFRDKHYNAKRSNGKFWLERIFKDSLSEIKDVLSNTIDNPYNGFQRFIDGIEFELSDNKIGAYSASVNSVHYFSVLPYGLNDKAVNKILLGEESIKEKDYYKIQVTFNQDGGGEDFEDVFIYWINKATFKPDYLAYSYNEDDGKGMRFREAYNERIVKGLRFVDYNNYKSINAITNLRDLAMDFQNGNLKLLSKIELKNIEVELINNL